MYIAGDDDQAVDPKYSQMLYDLYPKNQQHKLIVKRYPKTGHLIEPCYTPFCRASYHKVFGRYLVVSCTHSTEMILYT